MGCFESVSRSSLLFPFFLGVFCGIILFMIVACRWRIPLSLGSATLCFGVGHHQWRERSLSPYILQTEDSELCLVVKNGLWPRSQSATVSTKPENASQGSTSSLWMASVSLEVYPCWLCYIEIRRIRNLHHSHTHNHSYISNCKLKRLAEISTTHSKKIQLSFWLVVCYWAADEWTHYIHVH